MEDLIKLEHISKDFDHRPVLRDVTFSMGKKGDNSSDWCEWIWEKHLTTHYLRSNKTFKW